VIKQYNFGSGWIVMDRNGYTLKQVYSVGWSEWEKWGF